jgi:hypothetical protein
MVVGQRLISLFLFFLMSGCWTNEDEFYLYYSDFDCQKLPLIKPAKLGNCDRKTNDWILNSGYEIFGTSLKSVNVMDSIVIGKHYDETEKIYKKNKDTILIGNTNKINKTNSYDIDSKDTTWYIFNINARLTFAYKTQKEFNKKLISYTTKPVEFIVVEKWYEEFLRIGYLPWFPKEIQKELKK